MATDITNTKHYSHLRWILLSLMVFLGLLFHGCNYNRVEEGTYFPTTQEKLSLYQLQLVYEYPAGGAHYVNYSYRTWLPFSYAPLEQVSSTISSNSCDEASADKVKLKPTKTPWATAWDRRSVVLEMDEILKENGIVSKNVRVRMIAHAVVASGWKQNVWNFNAWGVKQGSWDKAWYVMPTIEEDDFGNDIVVEDATWRAFSNWPEAIADFQERISPASDRPAYREAYKHLTDDKISFRTAKAYWDALGSGNYYTASKFTGKNFAQLCGGVRAMLQSIPVEPTPG